jgi:hypothetical protein
VGGWYDEAKKEAKKKKTMVNLKFCHDYLDGAWKTMRYQRNWQQN